jgi:hypothetical protein
MWVNLCKDKCARNLKAENRVFDEKCSVFTSNKESHRFDKYSKLTTQYVKIY